MAYEEHTSKTPPSQLVLNQLSSAAPLLLECGTLKESSGNRRHLHQGYCARKKKPIIIILSSVSALFLIGLTVIGGFLILQYSSKNNGSPRTMSISRHHKNYPSSSPEALVGTENESSFENGLDHPNANISHVNNSIASFAGNWILHSQDEYFDSFLKAIGVGLFQRLFAPSITPEMDIAVQGPSTMTVQFKILITTSTTTFTFNEEVESNTVDGRTVMHIHSLEGGKWVTRERWFHGNEEKHAKYIRKLVDDKMIIHMFVDDITCIQIYKRIK